RSGRCSRFAAAIHANTNARFEREVERIVQPRDKSALTRLGLCLKKVLSVPGKSRALLGSELDRTCDSSFEQRPSLKRQLAGIDRHPIVVERDEALVERGIPQ